MENYKPNSFKSREEQQTAEQKKVQKVVSGPVTIKKKSGIQKFADTFIAEDVNKVKNYVVMDVLVPSIKKAICDIVKNGIDLFLYGDIDRSKKSNMPGSKVSYRSYFNNPSSSTRDRDSVSSRFDYDYDNIVLPSRGDAELVLAQMDDLIDKYKFVSIADLYDLLGERAPNHCANNYGWSDLTDAKCMHVRDGWLLKLPRALPID